MIPDALISNYKDYFLAKHRMSQFEADYKLWKKLRQMEEYHYHHLFHYFVDALQNKMFEECYNVTSQQRSNTND